MTTNTSTSNTKKAIIQKTYHLWSTAQPYSDDSPNTCLLLEPNDILHRVPLYNERVFIFSIPNPVHPAFRMPMPATPENYALLTPYLPKLNESPYTEDIEQLFEDTPELSAAGITVEQANDDEASIDQLCYFQESENLASLDDCETAPLHEWWDGSNWRYDWLGEEQTETIITVDPDFEDLDTWDGNNRSFRGRHNHGRLHEILTIDGDPVEPGTQYLLHQWSNYQGSQDTGEILTAAEADAVREEADE